MRGTGAGWRARHTPPDRNTTWGRHRPLGPSSSLAMVRRRRPWRPCTATTKSKRPRITAREVGGREGGRSVAHNLGGVSAETDSEMGPTCAHAPLATTLGLLLPGGRTITPNETKQKSPDSTEVGESQSVRLLDSVGSTAPLGDLARRAPMTPVPEWGPKINRQNLLNPISGFSRRDLRGVSSVFVARTYKVAQKLRAPVNEARLGIHGTAQQCCALSALRGRMAGSGAPTPGRRSASRGGRWLVNSEQVALLKGGFRGHVQQAISYIAPAIGPRTTCSRALRGLGY